VSQTSVGGARFLLALVGGLAVTGAASAGAYLFAIQPYQLRGSTIGWVGASLAVAFALRTLIVTVFTRPSYIFPDLPRGWIGILSVLGAIFVNGLLTAFDMD